MPTTLAYIVRKSQSQVDRLLLLLFKVGLCLAFLTTYGNMAQTHILSHIHMQMHSHLAHSFLAKEKVHTPHTFSPTQNPVYQIILLIQNPVCHASFPWHRTQCTILRHSGRSFLRLRSRCIILCADQTHTPHSLHSHHQLVTMYPLLSSQNTGSRFSKTIPIPNSVTLSLGLQSMGLGLVMRVHSLGYEDKTTLQFCVYLRKYLKTSLQKYQWVESKR